MFSDGRCALSREGTQDERVDKMCGRGGWSVARERDQGETGWEGLALWGGGRGQGGCANVRARYQKRPSTGNAGCKEYERVHVHAGRSYSSGHFAGG